MRASAALTSVYPGAAAAAGAANWIPHVGRGETSSEQRPSGGRGGHESAVHSTAIAASAAGTFTQSAAMPPRQHAGGGDAGDVSCAAWGRTSCCPNLPPLRASCGRDSLRALCMHPTACVAGDVRRESARPHVSGQAAARAGQLCAPRVARNGPRGRVERRPGHWGKPSIPGGRHSFSVSGVHPTACIADRGRAQRSQEPTLRCKSRMLRATALAVLPHSWRPSDCTPEHSVASPQVAAGHTGPPASPPSERRTPRPTSSA